MPGNLAQLPGEIVSAPDDLTPTPDDLTLAPGNLALSPSNLAPTPGNLAPAPGTPPRRGNSAGWAPNPAHDAVQVLGLADATLTVLDALGRPVRPAPASALSVAGLPAGLYLVRATAPGQPARTARLLVE